MTVRAIDTDQHHITVEDELCENTVTIVRLDHVVVHLRIDDQDAPWPTDTVYSMSALEAIHLGQSLISAASQALR